MLLIGLVLVVLGTVAAAAAFAVLQIQGAAGLSRSLGAPLINSALEHFGVEQVKAPEGGTGGSITAVLAFLTSVLAATVGLLLVLVAAAIGFVRSHPRRRIAALRDRTLPAVDHAAERVRGASAAARPHLDTATRQTRSLGQRTVRQSRRLWDQVPDRRRFGDGASNLESPSPLPDLLPSERVARPSLDAPSPDAPRTEGPVTGSGRAERPLLP